MVEPYATMMERLGIGTAVRRTGDVWRGAPGCSLSASAALIARAPDLVQRVVGAYVRAAAFVDAEPDETARIAAPYIGMHADIVRAALAVNRPDVNAIRNGAAMSMVLTLMQRLDTSTRFRTDSTTYASSITRSAAALLRPMVEIELAPRS